MADPLRRTLLAKLRGKKSKKGTAAGGLGVAANGGHREGKERVLQKRDEQAREARISAAGLSDEPEAMRGRESCLNGGCEPPSGEISVVLESALAQCETFGGISRRGDPHGQSSEELRLRGRVNEELLGVSVQRQTQARGSDRDEISGYNEQDLHSVAQVRTLEQKMQPAVVPQHFSGDSIGFGTGENRVLSRRKAFTDAREVNLTDGQYLVSKNNRTNVGCEKDLKIRSDGTDFSQQPDSYLGFPETFKDRIDNNLPAGHKRIFETNFNMNVKEMRQLAGPGQFQHNDNDNLEEKFIDHTESYEGCSVFTGQYKIASLQNTAFFPTELEIYDAKLASYSISVRESVQRHNSVYSEEDDYYDNESLPYYEPDSQHCKLSCVHGSKGVEIASLVHPVAEASLQNGPENSARETDRLRTKLQEAYYLLINAMNDISFENQVGLNGYTDRGSTSSSHSQESVCSQASVKAADSDAWSAGDHSAQQLSDTDSLQASHCDPREPRSRSRSSPVSRSFENLSAAKVRSSLQRSASDGAMKYPRAYSQCAASTRLVKQDGGSEVYGVAVEDGRARRGPPYDGLCSDDFLQDSGENGSLSGSSDSGEAHGGEQDFKDRRGASAKPHGVTVNKMQEWMQRGRMLSSEMKQRIAGSSLCGQGPPSSLAGRAIRKDASSKRTRPSGLMTTPQGSKTAGSATPCQAAQQTALIERVHCSSMGRWEARVTGCCEVNEPRLTANSITVSKKRNWLQQSSSRSQTLEDSRVPAAAEEDHGHVAPSPSPSSESQMLEGAVTPLEHRKALRLQHPHDVVTQATPAPHRTLRSALPHHRPVDPTEENDADDEGEIWYNPIPEDEEPEVLQGSIPEQSLSAQPLSPPAQGPQSSGAGPRDGDCAGGPLSCDTSEDCQGAPASKMNHTNATHSTECVQLHRQMFTCKPADESTAPLPTGADLIDSPSTGFSPPSSPNPSKKGSSINWSFPDKIKSPGTVRKLSLKMKKLPELSRKLSVKGAPSGSAQPEQQPSSPKSSGSSSGAESSQRRRPHPSPGAGAAASRNVISRYHLDSSVSTQQSFSKKKSSRRSKSASKGGYLSDGDSPELVAKSGKHNAEKAGKGKEAPVSCTQRLPGTEIDIDAFRHYSFVDQPKCSHYISGLMSVHFYGAEDLKPPRIDSRDVYCAIQVDSVNKARTALLTCRTTFLDMDHTFNIDLENAQHLKLVVFSWDPAPRRNKVCCHGTVVLPTLFRVTKTHQLAVKLEPRGLIYVKLTLMEQWENSLDSPEGDHDPVVFGVEAWRVVERENAGLMVPLLMEKCITEIEKRGCQVVGLYRLCGSAAVKKELREAFERDSKGVELSESQYPDINVITGVLKDYLRELPCPLITKQLYEAVLESMAKRPLRMGPRGCENDPSDSELTVGLLDCLPDVEKATLKMLLDHLKLVASCQEVNKMTCQNLAVCFGPVLLSQRQEASSHSNRVFIDSEELASALDFKKHIEVLHYLLQLWPVTDSCAGSASCPGESCSDRSASTQYLRRRRQRPQALNLSEAEIAGVLRPRPGRLDSPSNRYAGDWSSCGESYLKPPKEDAGGEADYDDVPSEDAESSEEEEPEQEVEQREEVIGPGETAYHSLSPPDLPAKQHTYQAYMKIQEISPGLSHQVNLKDLQDSIDTLIGNLERELNKSKLTVGY
nr:PREDICTED: rho GTPase-activating protein SYDE2 isoform X1 [Lepisosteus oculatus]